jgi:integrase/recombinase XerD
MFAVMRAVLNKPFNKIRISYSIRLRKSESKTNTKAGSAHLQVTKDRKTVRIPLGLEWTLDKFDPKKNHFLPRWPGDTEVNDVNLEAQQCLARVSELMVHYRLTNTAVTLQKLIDDYQNFASKEQVSNYFQVTADKLFKEGIVAKSTYKNYKQSINRLKLFEQANGEPLLFSHLNSSTGTRIYRFCRNQLKLAHNTSVLIIKHYKQFLRLAIKDQMQFDHNAMVVPTTYQRGFFEALEMEELKRLNFLFDHPDQLTDVQHEALRKFLFSCYTGLRIGDNKLVQSKNFSGNRLSIILSKGAGHIGKKLQLDLPEVAMRLIKGRKGYVFKQLPDPTVNKALKKCAHLAGIDKRVTFHVARNTFGTILVELGCDAFALRDFLGHSSLTDTQKYVKAGTTRKENLLKKFDTI